MVGNLELAKGAIGWCPSKVGADPMEDAGMVAGFDRLRSGAS